MARTWKATPLYKVWDHMTQRCNNSNHPKWKHYGGRGIKICPQWRSFAQFEKDVGPHPGKGWTFDRKDNNKGYLKGNTRWATQKTQQRNRNYTKLTMADAISIRTSKLSQLALAKQFNVSPSHIHRIIHHKAWA